jgi:diguanylate cyclase (GGDEF)-like protein/PAS domain S-box-containing protein
MGNSVTRVQGTLRPVASLDLRRSPDLQPLVDAWRREPSWRLADLENGPLASYADDLVIVEESGPDHFVYRHYGANVSQASGLDMLGRNTSEFVGGVGAFFAQTYREALRRQCPIYSVNKAKMTHVSHSWQRLSFPIAPTDDHPKPRVLAFVRTVALVSEVLTDFARDTGFLGGTLEPIVEDDILVDYALLTLSDPADVFGLKIMDRLSTLYDRPLSLSELDLIANANDGVTAISREVPNSMERFGRIFMLKVTGSPKQPVFSLTDASDLIVARRVADQRKAAMEDFAKTGSDWMWESDADHCMTMLSDAVTTQTGHPVDYFIGRSRIAFANMPENAEVFAEHLKDIENHRPFHNLVYKLKGADGRDCWMRVSGIPRFDGSGTFLGYRGTGSNITVEVEAREQAARRAQELAEAHRLGRLGGWSYNLESRLVTLSPEYLELVGMPKERAVMPIRKAMGCFAPQSREVVYRSFRKIMRSKGEDAVDVQWIAGRSKSMDLSVIAKVRMGENGRVCEVFGTVQDITERKKAERALEALAFHDPLTGLGNRAYFSRELDLALEEARLKGTNAGLLLLDLDHFKEVNDTLGHAAGDQLLRRVAERLSMTVTVVAGSVFRLGGDEFAVIVPQVRSGAELAALATSIISAFSGTLKIGDGSVHISTSIGMVILPAQTGDPDEGMRFADLALYEAKSEGRNRSLLFHTGLDEEVQDRVNLARDLREAVQNDGLEAHFQVQVDVMRGKVDGFEALARWNHPTRGYIPPSKFIPIAESSRVIADLGAWMVDAVCRQGKAWLDAGGAPLQMAVNLSVAQLWHRDVEHDIRSTLDATGFPPELLCVELTESVFSDEAMPRIQRLFASLKRLGVQIALDDFGTGYSSLKYLNDLSFDKIKIDRSFVAQCDQDSDRRRLLQGVIGMGKGLGLGIVVEGVESDAELQVVCDLGCDTVQGFFFAKPKPFHEACLDAAQIEAEYGFNPVFWKDHEAADRTMPFMHKVRERLARHAKSDAGVSRRHS